MSRACGEVLERAKLPEHEMDVGVGPAFHFACDCMPSSCVLSPIACCLKPPSTPQQRELHSSLAAYGLDSRGLNDQRRERRQISGQVGRAAAESELEQTSSQTRSFKTLWWSILPAHSWIERGTSG